MKMRLACGPVAWLWLVAGVGFLHAAEGVRFPGWFTDHMVLQRDRPIPLWGSARPGAKVSVRLGTELVSTNADAAGRWRIAFAPRAAGGPFTLSAEDGQKVELTDVFVGDVWLIGGQSNMEIPVKHGLGAEETIQTSEDNGLRLVHIVERPEYQPQEDVEGQWQVASPRTVSGFSCVGYAFARKLRETLKDVPIGLIQAPVGSTVAETWLSRTQLENAPAFAHYVKDLEETAKKFPALGKKKAGGLDPRKVPTVMYNGMLRPLIPYGIRGVIWWQGLANSVPVEKAYEYRLLFPYLIKCWREQWGQGDFPFIFAEEPTLKWANKKPGFMLIREAQLQTAEKIPHTAVIVNSDVRHEADPTLIHFPEKPVVGQRMALAALAIEYGKPAVYSGPIYDPAKTRIEGGKMRLGFRQVESGLKARQGELADFVVAGADQAFVKAQAKIDGDTVLVWADAVAQPVAVRYDWDDWTGATLMNKDGFPASPFRTDDWPIK